MLQFVLKHGLATRPNQSSIRGIEQLFAAMRCILN